MSRWFVSIAALAALAGCGGTAPPPAPPSNRPAVAAHDALCKQPREAMRELFVTAARAQLARSLYREPDPDADRPAPSPDDPDPSAIDPGHFIHIDRAESFDNVLYVHLQIGYDGLYAVGVAGIFVGCRYVPISRGAVTPIDDEVLRPDALVALGWLTADAATKQRLARDFVVDVLLGVADPVMQANDDFDAEFTGDDGKPVHTPVFYPPNAKIGPDGSAEVEAWLPIPGNMGTQPDDPNGYRLVRYTIRPSGEIAFVLTEPFYGDRPSRKHPRP